MITGIEEELYKIINPVIQKTDASINLSSECRINMELIAVREKINLINTLKTFFRVNNLNPNLAIIFSKHISIILSKVLFKSLDDSDQNVRIASDECINLIIRLTTSTYASHIIYNLFIETKNCQSTRSLNGALAKFSSLSVLIKISKRISYINNVLPVLKTILQRSEQSVSLTLIEALPKMALNLFPYASDVDIEKSILVTLVLSLQSTQIVSHQRSIANLVAITCIHMKDRKAYLEKVLKYFLLVDPNEKEDENLVRGMLFVHKALIVSCQEYGEHLDLVEFALVLLRLIFIFDGDHWNGSIKNLALDCLMQLLTLYQGSTCLWSLLQAGPKQREYYYEKLSLGRRDGIFELTEEKEEQSVPEDPNELSEPLHENIEIGSTDDNNSHLTTEIFECDEIINPPNEIIEYTGEVFSLQGSDHESSHRESMAINETLLFSNADTVGTNESTVLGAKFSFWMGSTIDYLIKMLIVEFLPECTTNVINNDGNQEDLESGISIRGKRQIRISSKVLAINCLTQICRMDYQLVLTAVSLSGDVESEGNPCLPTAIDCVSRYCSDEDAQLSGSAILLLAQVLRSHFVQSKYFIESSSSNISVNYSTLIETIQTQINNPISGQHLKSVLSAVKLFLSDLISSQYGTMAVDMCESILRYTNHNYKLVRKEILLICQVIDFRSLNALASTERGSGVIKKTLLPQKFVTAVLNLLSDVEQDIREDACESLMYLISNGAFDREKLFCDCSTALHFDLSNDSLTNKGHLIPFLHRDINVSLEDIRKKLQQKGNYHHSQSTIHRAVHLIIGRVLLNPVSSTKEMKLSINEISGCIHALLVLHEKYPISTHSKVWISQNINSSSNLTETRTLIGYCLSLLNTSLIISDICLHTDLLGLISKLFFHGGIKHLMLNNLITERTVPETGINTELNNNLYVVSSMKQFMVHICRILNIYWHIFQFITPSIPPHKTVLPNLSSQTHSSPVKKKVDTGPPRGSPDSQSTTDSRPPRIKSSLGFFVNEPNYMMIHKVFSVAYNSYLISFDASLHTDRLLNLLTQCLDSLGALFEFLTFSEVSMHIEELLAYCTIFYNILPKPTVTLIIKLLGSLFGTNLTAQWDPFLSQLFHQLFSADFCYVDNPDLVENIINTWKNQCSKDGSQLQSQLKNISTSPDGNDTLHIYKWRQAPSDTYLWIKASGKRREPGILRQIASTNSLNRPSLGHYIGLFEKHVFQCMRQYLVSPTELQTSIIKLLCQLIYLRVNYCQLDSEQKFLNIIQNQLENFTSYNIDDGKDASLIIEIIEFLILISYEKAAGNKKDQPILNIAQVIRGVESLLINGISIKSIIIPCVWKIVCDLFVHRSVWINYPGNFNLLPKANTINEIDVQREAIVEFLLRQLIKYPETLEILALIVEHSAREQEMKWQNLSTNIWGRLSKALLEDSIDFSSTSHIDHLHRLLRLLPSKIISQPSIDRSIVNLALKFDDLFSKSQYLDIPTIVENYRLHIVQAVRSVLCLQTIFIHEINYQRDYKTSDLISDLHDEASIKQEFYEQVVNIFKLILHFYNYLMNNHYLRDIIPNDYLSMARKLMEILLLIFIDNKILDIPNVSTESQLDIPLDKVSRSSISTLEKEFTHLPRSDVDLLLLWNEIRLSHEIILNSTLVKLNTFEQKSTVLCYNYVLQSCRHIVLNEEKRTISDLIKQLLTDHYIVFLSLFKHNNVRKILEIINQDENLSIHILETFNDFSKEIIPNTSFLILWLDLIADVHILASNKLITILFESIFAHAQDSSVVILMKVESLLCSRIDMLSEEKFDVGNLDKGISKDLSIFETIKSISKRIENTVVPMPALQMKIKKIENLHEQHLISLKLLNPVLDPLDFDKMNSNEINEKQFWKSCVEKALKNHDQDIRLGPRLLQGGSANDLEQLFGIKLISEDSFHQVKSSRNDVVSNLPPRFVQQCLRLGFLRSGGGVVQEGIRVDLIFRLGEKLVFEELRFVLEKSKECLKNNDFNQLSPIVLIGLIAALNDYLSLSCQLSVPMPVTNDTSENLTNLIEYLCILITKSKRFRSRILVEELLVLITSCYGSLPVLTDEGIKLMGNNLLIENVSVIVDFLYLLVDQFLSNKLSGSLRYSSNMHDGQKKSVRMLLILDKILKYYYAGKMDDFDTNLQKKLRLAVISISRLPCVVLFTRNPKNIKDIELKELDKLLNSSQKIVVELDCLSKMNRDDLTTAQTILNSLGWTSRLMYEETWLLFLDLLHDKGPSSILSNQSDSSTVNLSSEEVVEQGHCDSLGLLGLTDMILQTTARPNPGNPVVAQLEHKTRDKTPNLLHTKTGRKLSSIHAQLEEEIFHCHRGFRMLSAGWTITSWNLEREDSVLKYRHDQININVLSKRISIGSRSPQISGSNSNNLDVLSCLHSLPIICQQWFDSVNDNGKRKSVALWPRACALRSAVMLMDLFSSRDQVQWLLDSLLELYKYNLIEDDWITASWMCIGLSKCVAVLESSSNSTLASSNITGKSPAAIQTNSIYGLSQSIKLIELCLNSDLTILQQSALHSSMSLLQMMVCGKNTWDLPPGSLVELKNVHDMVMRYLDNQLLIMDYNVLNNERRASISDSFTAPNSVAINSNTLSQAVSSGAASIANTVSGLTSINSVNNSLSIMNTSASNSLSYFASSSLPRLLKPNQGTPLRTERHNYIVMAAACFYCERYQDALQESDILNNFVVLAKNIMQSDKKKDASPQLLLTMCRCLERISLTQRVSIIVTEQIIRLCANFLKTCKSTSNSLPVLGLFLTSCYLSLASSSSISSTPAVFETAFNEGPSNSNGENQLVMLERINLFWKRLTDSETMDVIESRILSRLISNIMTDFMSSEELLNKTIHQLLHSWPRSQCVAKTLFDVITKCLNKPDGEKLIRKWTLMVLQSLASCRPDTLSIWATTIVLIASGSSVRSCLRALFSQCIDWLTRFEKGENNLSELETAFCLAALGFVQDMARDTTAEAENKATFLRAMQSSSNIPAFRKFFSIAREKHLL